MKKLRHTWIAICIMLLLSACTAGQMGSTAEEPSQGPTWQEQYDLGVRYLSEGNYQEAIIAFTAAIEIDPKKAPAYVGRGDTYVKSGETEENLVAAKVDYETAIELDETSAEAYLGLADVYIRRGDTEKALEILRIGAENSNGDDNIEKKIQQIKSMEDFHHVINGEITVLTKQSMILYNSVKYPGLDNSESYELYEYDSHGYMIHTESWSKKNSEWEQVVTTSYTCEPSTEKWTRITDSKYGGYRQDELNDYRPGTYHYTGVVTSLVSIMCSPHSNMQDIVYNTKFSTSKNEDTINWYTAKYTYDENGNAVQIESYSVDGALLGICKLEYEVIHIGVE